MNDYSVFNRAVIHIKSQDPIIMLMMGSWDIVEMAGIDTGSP